MNRLIFGGLAAIIAAGGGGAWWMMSRSAPPDVASAAIVQPTDARPAADADARDMAPPVSETAAEAAPVMAASPQDSVSVERGACFGPCPIYTATVYGDDRLVFEGRRFVAREGRHEAKLAAGSFARLLQIAKRHDFASMDSKWPDEKGLNCPEAPTDLPTVVVTVAADDLRHSVTYYEGCGGTPAAERVEAMVADLDKALALGEWVGRREDWYGKRSLPDK